MVAVFESVVLRWCELGWRDLAGGWIGVWWACMSSVVSSLCLARVGVVGWLDLTFWCLWVIAVDFVGLVGVRGLLGWISGAGVWVLAF